MQRSRCEKCSAPLSVPHGATAVVCLFCRTENVLVETRPSRVPRATSPYEPGDLVMVRWNGRFWPAIVQAPANPGSFHIRYEGCSDNWDEVVEASRIRPRHPSELVHHPPPHHRSRAPLYATLAGLVAVGGVAILLLLASGTPAPSAAEPADSGPPAALPTERAEIPASPTDANTVVVPLSPNMPLDICLSVEVRWGRDWWESSIVGENPDGTVRVHYLGWSDAFDENVPRDRIRVRVPRSAIP